jgi:NAD(P)-dependent dehydrogenase (short-subunit alcohol dehydrogenase family)
MAQPQTIVITGASDGIGAAAARQLVAGASGSYWRDGRRLRPRRWRPS